MTHLTLTLLRTLVADLRQRAGGDDAEEGLSTLEIVVIALGLFLIAGALVAAITTAVNSRLGQIN